MVGMSEASVLAALSNGCTGIWCAICEEGAVCGHASALMTLTNLARMGNQHVLKKFDLPQMRKSAIRITEITTGRRCNNLCYLLCMVSIHVVCKFHRRF